MLKGFDPFLCLLAASSGNISGSVLNYGAGFFAGKFLFKYYLKNKNRDINTGISRFKKYGKPSLFFAWMPIIGDPLTLAAGILKINFYFFLFAVGTGKILRYIILIKGFHI